MHTPGTAVAFTYDVGFRELSAGTGDMLAASVIVLFVVAAKEVGTVVATIGHTKNGVGMVS